MLKFTGDFEVGAEDIGCNGSIRAGSLMYEFQEIATSHAEALGIGVDELMADNRIWVMSKLRFRKYFELTEGQSYRIETYPRPKRGVTFYRDYYVYDKDDRLAAAGISHWCVINFRTRRIEKTDIDFDDEYIDKAAFDDGIGKIRADNPVYAGEHVVVQEDIDINQHPNNCRYADMVEDIIAGKEYSDFTINVSKEARLGDVIGLYIEEKGESIVVVGKLADDTVVFQSEVRK